MYDTKYYLFLFLSVVLFIFFIIFNLTKYEIFPSKGKLVVTNIDVLDGNKNCHQVLIESCYGYGYLYLIDCDLRYRIGDTLIVE
jgi:hypothetical protein